MAYIESHQTLGRHPKTRKLTRLLGVNVPQAVGHLHLLWHWALDYAEDGSLARYESPDIAEAVMWEGEPSVFINAMCSAGFLDVDEDGGLHIHDWLDYSGRLIEKRRENAARMRTSRATHVQRTLDAHAGANVPKQRETKRREKETRAERTPAGESLSLDKENITQETPDPDAERTADKAVFEAWCTATGRERVASLGERRSWMTQIRELRISVGLSPPDVVPLIVQYRAKFGADRSPTPGQVAGVYSQLTGTLNGHHPNGAGAARKTATTAAEAEAASRDAFHKKTAVVREFAGGNLPT